MTRYQFVPDLEHVRKHLTKYDNIQTFYEGYEAPVDVWLEKNNITAVEKFPTFVHESGWQEWKPGVCCEFEVDVPRYAFHNEADALLFKLTFSDWVQA